MLSWVLMASCGAAAPAPAVEKPVVTVAPPAEDASDESGDAPPEAAPSRRADLDECVALLRSASDLPSAPEERDLYAAALDAERRGDLTEARRTYFELIQNYPRSRFVPLTYLAFGEQFREEAAKDPSKAQLAIQAMREVLKYPPADNPVFAYAALRIAELEEDEGSRALADYKRAIEAADKSACGEAISDLARAGVVTTYVTVGRPTAAWSFFRNIAPDDDTAAAMIVSLMDAYESSGMPAKACEAALSATTPPARVEARARRCKKTP